MPEKEIFKKETQTKFFALAGSLSDLTKIDFSSVNIRCLKIDSEELLSVFKTATYEGWAGNRIEELFSEFKKNFWDYKRLYILLPIDFSKEFNADDFYLCHELLLLLFPSDLTVKYIIYFQLFDDKFLSSSGFEEYTFITSGAHSIDNYLYYREDDLAEINSFIQVFFERIKSIKYIRTAVNAYISSFHERNPSMSFVSLCISLESIINNTTEINYRICRNVSVLISDNKLRAEAVFDNLKLIYDLRSKIVHGSEYSIEKVIEYIPYLQCVVSRMIIEIVLQNIQNMDELNAKLTFAGFGDKQSLSKHYKNMTLNITSYVDSFIKRLKK